MAGIAFGAVGKNCKVKMGAIDYLALIRKYYKLQIQRIDLSMSLSKKRAQRSLNNSTLSEISNSQNLKDSKLFKNQVLADIRNLNTHSDSKSLRKQIQQSSTSKKKKKCEQYIEFKEIKEVKEVRFKENDKSKENKISNYLGLSKLIDERNILINTQQKQIENLKSALERVRKELEMSRAQYEKKKIQDMTSLKKQEKDNQENIKELQILKIGMRQLKNKIQTLEQEKDILQKRSAEYLQQNEELTIKMTSLKQEYLNRIPDEKELSDLKHEAAILKEQVKLAKQLQIQKITLEQRCHNFERKINDYIVRYNQVQTDYNQTQIKYYRAQKQNDDLKMNIEQLAIENKNIRKMLEEEKKILAEQTAKWKVRISRLEDYQKADRNLNQYYETKTILDDLEDRYTHLQQESKLENKIQLKNMEIKNLNTKISEQCAQISNLKQQMNRVIDSSQNIEENLRKSIETIKQTHAIQILELSTELQSLKAVKSQLQMKIQEIISEQSKSKLKEWEEFNKERQQTGAHIREVESKLEELQQQRESKVKEIQTLKRKINITNTDLQQAHLLLEMKVKQLEQSETKVQQLTQQLSNKQSTILHLQQESSNLSSQLNEIQSQYSSSERNEHKYYQILQKMQILQGNIQRMHSKQAEQTVTIQRKEEEIKRLEGIIANANAQLKDIKVLVQEYKLKIQNYTQTISQNQRRYDNLAYLSRESELKWEEELKYFKNKYEQSFKQNMELSDKLCELQTQFTEQVNKNTQMIRVNSYLQVQIQKGNQEKLQNELKYGKEIQMLGQQIKKLRDKVCEYEVAISNSQMKLRQLQIMSLEKQSRINCLANQCKELQESNQKQVAQLIQSHSRQIQELSSKLAQKTQQTLQLEQLRFQNQLRTQAQRQLVLTQRIEQLMKDLSEKDKVIQKNYQLIQKKQKEIQNISNLRSNIQNEQMRKIKEYNVKLSQQVEEVTLQFNRNLQELRETHQLCQKFKGMKCALQRDLAIIQQNNFELINETNNIKTRNIQQSQENARNLSQLKVQISSYEQKIRFQREQINAWEHKYQNIHKEYQKVQQECTKASRIYLEESNRKNKQSNREIDNYKTQIKVLQQENANLQKIMDRQLGKRKAIIEELIHQKKILYDQIGTH